MQKLIITISILTSCFLLPTIILAHGDEHGELIIRMTSNGFEPKEMTVTEGDEILFINNDDTDRWPASNFHPTHSLYADFDPKIAVKPGESWKFAFNKHGTWRMHDHLTPHMTGTIVVLPAPSVVAGEDPSKGPTLSTDSQGRTLDATDQGLTLWGKIKAFFSKLFKKSDTDTASAAVNPVFLREFKSQNEKGKFACLEERAKLEDPETAWEYVLAAYNTPNGVVGNPHDMAHLVGQLLFKKRGFDGLSTCTPVFAFGCYHGLMEVAFDQYKDSKDETSYENALLEAEKGCAQIGSPSDTTYWSCIHGMGHGIATFRDHNIEKSLTDCDVNKESIRTYCNDGVFMEFSISAPPSFYQKDNPIYPCDAVAEDYKVACARSQVQVMRLRFGMDTASISDACGKTLNDKIIYHCVDSLGYFIGQTSNGSASSIVSGCNEIADKAAAAQCLAASAGELVFQNAAGWPRAVDQICKSLKGEYEEACRTRVEQVKQSYGRK